ncbi:hypothetical protein BASA62_005187 [Batrachochytrium salamandrivorans]|nr:hypothetical protein BASA62_005187 [Batrachochytrium salamandrivorans]
MPFEEMFRLAPRSRGQNQGSAATVLAEFQSAAANLEPDERIKLVVYAYENKICSLCWDYFDKEDVNSIIPLLINNCPELASLYVYSKHHSASDFVSSMLEHSNNKIKVLSLPRYTTGNISRFFAALGQSQALDLSIGDSPEFAQGLFEYLARDLLLKLVECKFSQPITFTHLPKSITKLELKSCTFVGGLDWSFLAGSNVRELDLYNVKGVDGNQLGSALADYLRAKGLDKLRVAYCDFVDETLAKVGLGRIKRLMLEGGRVSDASIELIALALESPNNEMKELSLWYDDTASSSTTHLVPALKHPNCNLAKLSFGAYLEHEKAAQRVEDMFYNRLALFVLLQGRQVKRRYCPLRRLPVEMFRDCGASRCLRSSDKIDDRLFRTKTEGFHSCAGSNTRGKQATPRWWRLEYYEKENHQQLPELASSGVWKHFVSSIPVTRSSGRFFAALGHRWTRLYLARECKSGRNKRGDLEKSFQDVVQPSWEHSDLALLVRQLLFHGGKSRQESRVDAFDGVCMSPIKRPVQSGQPHKARPTQRSLKETTCSRTEPTRPD